MVEKQAIGNIYIYSCIAKGSEPFFYRSFDASKISLSVRVSSFNDARGTGFVGMAERGTIRHKHSAIFIVGFPGERARIRAGGWNCQKSFELRYPSSWNSSRAARGSRLKPENQARYLRNEKGSCGPQPLSLWNNLPPDEIVCMTFSPPILEYKSEIRIRVTTVIIIYCSNCGPRWDCLINLFEIFWRFLLL